MSQLPRFQARGRLYIAGGIESAITVKGRLLLEMSFVWATSREKNMTSLLEYYGMVIWSTNIGVGCGRYHTQKKKGGKRKYSPLTSYE